DQQCRDSRDARVYHWLGLRVSHRYGEHQRANSLTAGSVTLAGGSITGSGNLITSSVSGYGTISSKITGTTFNANATDGTNFGGFSPFTNGTPGTAITLSGQNNLANDTFNVSNHGNFNFQGVTLS